jgi:TATA-binding protein-associated factor
MFSTVHIVCFVAGLPWEENEIAHERWCNDLAMKFLCVFVLDRFGDFVSDQVVAPVRETVSQTLASLLLHMPRRSALRVHSILLEMIRQDFSPPAKPVNGAHKGRQVEKGHVWEVRHAGLLGIKYEVAVRSDLVTVDIEESTAAAGCEVLRGVVDAAVLGYVLITHRLRNRAEYLLGSATGTTMFVRSQLHVCCR